MGKFVHGEGSSRTARSPEYRTWKNMKSRCYNCKMPQFKDWGGRGIKVCRRWKNNYAAFLRDMGRRPGPDYEIHRINNDGNYEPSNCIWLHQSQNKKFKRNTVLLTLNDVTKTQADWAKELGIARSTLQDRRVNGWSDFHILTVKPKGGQKLHLNGKLL